MPTITIDGRSIEGPAGAMLLPVALENGIHIPHYCWHPKLSIDGS
jgi:NADH-quinone oxidoreductase subunit G